MPRVSCCAWCDRSRPDIAPTPHGNHTCICPSCGLMLIVKSDKLEIAQSQWNHLQRLIRLGRQVEAATAEERRTRNAQRRRQRYALDNTKEHTP